MPVVQLHGKGIDHDSTKNNFFALKLVWALDIGGHI